MAEVEVTRDGGVLTLTLNRPDVLNAFNTAMHKAFQAALKEARRRLGSRSRHHRRRPRLLRRPGPDRVPGGRRGHRRPPARGLPQEHPRHPRAREAGDRRGQRSCRGRRPLARVRVRHPHRRRVGELRARLHRHRPRSRLGRLVLHRAAARCAARVRVDVAEPEALGGRGARAGGSSPRSSPTRRSRRERPSSPVSTPRRRRGAIGMTKRLFDNAQTATLDEQLELEAQLQAAATQTDDFREGVTAFLEKRPPQFHRLAGASKVSTVDYHTAGEPFRIVTGGVDPLPGRTILDKRRHALEHVDDVRRLLVNEPRGHADMYGCFVTEPEDDGADLGVVFFHNAGYSTACGHGTIALVTWAVESGVVDAAEPETRVVVDCPSGRLETVARVEDGDVQGRALSQRARRTCTRAAWRPPGAPSTWPSAALSTPSSRSGSLPPSCRALIELGRASRPTSSGARDRPSAGAGAARRLRRRLLAARGRRAAARAAQRHGVRRRRGRPLAVRQRDVGADGAARRARAAPSRASSAREFRAWIVDRTEVAGRPAVITEVEGIGAPHGHPRVRPRARATSSAPASCCASRTRLQPPRGSRRGRRRHPRRRRAPATRRASAWRSPQPGPRPLRVVVARDEVVPLDELAEPLPELRLERGDREEAAVGRRVDAKAGRHRR